MKTRILLVVVLMLITFSGNAQRSNIRIGYIDTEYILENIPEYNEALSQLDAKVQKWKGDIDLKLRDIDKKKLDLRNERVLLTKELIEEKEEDIKAEEAEILDYQQKRFGPNGDLIIQKQKLIEPIQDQVLTAVQELAKAKKYDFIFDKSADVVMMYSNKRYDLSDFIVRTITRTAKRQQAKNKKAKKDAETEEVVPVINEELEAKQKAQADSKAKRQQILEERKKKALELREAKKKAFEEKRKKMLEAREAKKNKNSGPPSPPTEDVEEEK
jgi:Skp family chaperone for outer membrane proteins